MIEITEIQWTPCSPTAVYRAVGSQTDNYAGLRKGTILDISAPTPWAAFSKVAARLHGDFRMQTQLAEGSKKLKTIAKRIDGAVSWTRYGVGDFARDGARYLLTASSMRIEFRANSEEAAKLWAEAAHDLMGLRGAGMFVPKLYRDEGPWELRGLSELTHISSLTLFGWEDVS